MKDVLPFAPVAVGFRCCDATRTRFVEAGIEKLNAAVTAGLLIVAIFVPWSVRVVGPPSEAAAPGKLTN